MNIMRHTHPDNLEKYSFLWSEVRLVIAAIALFLGGVPPILKIASSSLVFPLLTVAWIISGAASGYLLYRWNVSGQKLFGGTDTKDKIAFLVSVVSGINLGIVGITGKNIGMSIYSSYPIFIIVGLIYLASFWHLHTRWHTSGKRLF